MRIPNKNMRGLLSSVTSRTTLGSANYASILMCSGSSVLSASERIVLNTKTTDADYSINMTNVRTELLKTRVEKLNAKFTNIYKTLDGDTSSLNFPLVSGTNVVYNSLPATPEPTGIAFVYLGPSSVSAIRQCFVLSVGAVGSGADIEMEDLVSKIDYTSFFSDLLIKLT